MLDKHLIPCSDTGESKVFYYKMKGDYHRYLAEFATANERKEAAENSLVAYKAASDIALTELATTHPIRSVILVMPKMFRALMPTYNLNQNQRNQVSRCCDIVGRKDAEGLDYKMRKKCDTHENMSIDRN